MGFLYGAAFCGDGHFWLPVYRRLQFSSGDDHEGLQVRLQEGRRLAAMLAAQGDVGGIEGERMRNGVSGFPMVGTTINRKKTRGFRMTPAERAYREELETMGAGRRIQLDRARTSLEQTKRAIRRDAENRAYRKAARIAEQSSVQDGCKIADEILSLVKPKIENPGFSIVER